MAGQPPGRWSTRNDKDPFVPHNDHELMESPTPAPHVPAPGSVPVPLADVLRIANEYERGGPPGGREAAAGLHPGASPNQGDALHLSGIVAFRLGDPAKSLEFMQASLRHGIDTPLYLRNICEVYRTLGRLDEALTAAQRATMLAPADPLCLHNQAIIHYHRGELDACLDCAGQRAAHRSRPARRAFRPCRGAVAARRHGGGLGRIRMALPHRRRRAADAADRQAAMGRRAAGRAHGCC